MMTFISCAPVYTPNTVNAPLFEEKGDANLSLTTGTNGVDLQTSYAITEHIGVVANGSFSGREGESDTSGFHKHAFGELGGVYYLPIGESGRFEILGGFGSGNATTISHYNFFGPRKKKATGFYHRFFMQMDLGLISKVFDGGLSIRAAHVNFHRFETDDNKSKQNISSLFMEPALTMRLGWKYIKLHSQLGLSFPLQNPEQEYPGFDWQPFIFNIGIHLNMNVLNSLKRDEQNP
jgi:hypothetical protein